MSKKKRCGWSGTDENYVRYHDEEWGVPVHDDQVLFEFLILEGAQAGLSWATILNKREGYRKAFADFDVKRVARMREPRLEKLLLDPSIVRNRLKVYSAVSNAKAFIAVQKEFGSFDHYLWGFVDYKPVQNKPRKMADVPARTELSDTLSKDLKKRGFKFVGSTIVYAYLQAVGVVNDHEVSCFRHKPCARLS